MADDIIQFSPGGKVTAEETNENNLLLKEWALDNSESQAYIDAKMTQLTNDLNNQIGAINTQLSSLNTQISRINNSKISATQSKGSNGYVKLSNGIIIQWGRVGGMGQGTEKTITLLSGARFSNGNYSVGGSSTYYQGSGDKSSTWRAHSFTANTFKIQSRFEQGNHNETIYWIAIGY